MHLIFVTRPSALARWQTQWVIRALQAACADLSCSEQVITTQGDRILDKPLPEIGGKGLFTQELENELRQGRVHAAVHSLKDLPIENAPGLILGAIPARAEARDALISHQGLNLDDLPEGAVIGTSSLRRAAQLLAYRSDLRIKPLRGNVDTRLRKALEGQYDAIVLAGAGVIRLGLEQHVTQWLPLEIMLPAPGQGALAVQCRTDDSETRTVLEALEDQHARKTTTAERAFLAGLGAGCSLPIAAYAELRGTQIELKGVAASSNGERVIRVTQVGEDPSRLGWEAAQSALDQGAGEFIHG